jgi:hypothetical protein
MTHHDDLEKVPEKKMPSEYMRTVFNMDRNELEQLFFFLLGYVSTMPGLAGKPPQEVFDFFYED